MAALLAKELVEIYSTSTPREWRKPKGKGTSFLLITEMSVTIAGFNIYTRGLTTSPGQTRPVSN